MDEIKRTLNIDGFREISIDKIVEFVSLLPSMDKEVAIEIIKQFPSFVDFASTLIKKLELIVEEGIKSNEYSNNKSLEAYRKILDELSILLQKEHITEDERKWVINEMLNVADKMSDKDLENKVYLNNVIKYGGLLAEGSLLFGAAVSGVKSGNIKIPRI